MSILDHFVSGPDTEVGRSVRDQGVNIKVWRRRGESNGSSLARQCSSLVAETSRSIDDPCLRRAEPSDVLP